MNRTASILPVMVAAAAVVLLSGCEDKPITLRYDRPAEYEMPESVRRIAVAEFGGTTGQDKRFGNVAADMLASDLDAYNKQYSRYQLVDRKRLQAILDEQDLQLAVSDASSATEVGKIAKVDAIIYGTVTTSSRDEQASKMSMNFSSGSPQTVYYTKRYCMVSINFTMDDVTTGKTLTSVTLTRQYDSDKDSGGGGLASMTKALGVGGGGSDPADQIVTRLIQQCVDEFVSKISPHCVVITPRLEKGKSKIVQTGNKLALAGDYGEALDCYIRGLSEKPDDDGALFNAGLMYEAQEQFDKAEELYSKAFALKDKEKYVLARKRVRTEAANNQ